jgi:hypothetical protein
VDERWLISRAGRPRAGVGLPSALTAHEKAIVEDALRATDGRESFRSVAITFRGPEKPF